MLSARFAITDYASFIAWRDWGWPDPSVRNCFGAPAIFSSDGALVFGVMAPHTLNGNMLYPPSGSLEPRDVRSDGTVDVLGSIATELMEETGLDVAAAEQGGLVAYFDGPRLAIVQKLVFPLSFDEINARFAAHARSGGHSRTGPPRSHPRSFADRFTHAWLCPGNCPIFLRWRAAMKLSFHTLDVFTNRRFGGNPLAVVLDADDLSTEQMQTIAREFNLSETIFVRKPADPANTASVQDLSARAPKFPSPGIRRLAAPSCWRSGK